MTTQTNIESERNKLNTKLLLLDTIESAEKELKELKFNHKETEGKELSIHLLWKRYNEI